ncbi:hypothetical protein CD133_03390 [Staphylococcus massiliensis CCUG 55927]|nr:hypothetical protein CD133_03390 [Staphylococcus massiliensis CCUG 55927]
MVGSAFKSLFMKVGEANTKIRKPKENSKVKPCSTVPIHARTRSFFQSVIVETPFFLLLYVLELQNSIHVLKFNKFIMLITIRF